MRRLAALLVLLVVPTPGKGCPADVVEGFTPRSHYEAAHDAAMEKLREKYPDLVSLEVRPRVDTETGQTYVDVWVKVGREREKIRGRFHYSVTADGMLRQEMAEVDEPFRDARLNRLMLAYLVDRHPELTRLEAGLADVNHAALIVALATETEGAEHRALTVRYRDNDAARRLSDSTVVDEIRGLRRKPQAQKYRRRILDAYLRLTPAGRTGAEVGFGNLSHIVLTIERDGTVSARAVMTRGDGAQNGENARVIIDDPTATPPRHLELMPDGTLVRHPANPLPEEAH